MNIFFNLFYVDFYTVFKYNLLPDETLSRMIRINVKLDNGAIHIIDFSLSNLFDSEN